MEVFRTAVIISVMSLLKIFVLNVRLVRCYFEVYKLDPSELLALYNKVSLIKESKGFIGLTIILT